MHTRMLMILLLCSPLHIFSQNPADKIAMVIDSILVEKDPEPGNGRKVTEVALVRVLKNKDSLRQLGYPGYDGVTFIFTKNYVSRPDSIRRIPTSGQLLKINGSGPFIDYYYSGKKRGEGTLVKGKLNGPRNLYFQNGQLMAKKIFQNGEENGLMQEFYPDGRLRQEGYARNGKEEGLWNSDFPNGLVKIRGNYKDGEPADSVVRYYSSGIIKERIYIKDGKLHPDPSMAKIASLLQKSKESSAAGDYDLAIKYCNKTLALDSSFAGAWFSKATLELNQEKFDVAIADFDLALHYEPYTLAAYTNRAFARIRKQEFAAGRSILKTVKSPCWPEKIKWIFPLQKKKKYAPILTRPYSLEKKKPWCMRRWRSIVSERPGFFYCHFIPWTDLK